MGGPEIHGLLGIQGLSLSPDSHSHCLFPFYLFLVVFYISPFSWHTFLFLNYWYFIGLDWYITILKFLAILIFATLSKSFNLKKQKKAVTSTNLSIPLWFILLYLASLLVLEWMYSFLSYPYPICVSCVTQLWSRTLGSSLSSFGSRLLGPGYLHRASLDCLLDFFPIFMIVLWYVVIVIVWCMQCFALRYAMIYLPLIFLLCVVGHLWIFRSMLSCTSFLSFTECLLLLS